MPGLIVVKESEKRIEEWIFNLAGCSYVVGGTLFLLLFSIAVDDFLFSSVMLKSLGLLTLYGGSLYLIHLSESKERRERITLWVISILIHVGLMAFVSSLFGFQIAMIVMIPEILILVLMLIGLFKIIMCSKRKICGDEIVEFR